MQAHYKINVGFTNDADFVTEKSAKDIVLEGLDAYARADWPRFVELLDRRSLERWRKQFVDGNTRAPTIEDWRRRAPNASLERLASLEASFRRPVEAFIATLSQHLDGVETLEQLHALSSEEVLIKVLMGKDPYFRMQKLTATAYAEAGLPIPAPAWPRPEQHFRIVEETLVAPRKAHVSFVEENAGDSTSRETWVLRPDRRGRWRILVTGDLLHVGVGHATVIDDPVVIAYIQRHNVG